MAVIVEQLRNDVSASEAWSKITSRLKAGYAVVEVRAKIETGPPQRAYWELTSRTAELVPPPPPPSGPTSSSASTTPSTPAPAPPSGP